MGRYQMTHEQERIWERFERILELLGGGYVDEDGVSDEDVSDAHQGERRRLRHREARNREQDKNRSSKLLARRANYFRKVYSYSNSRLSFSLPPLKLYLPTYPLLCLAAQYSRLVYDKHESSPNYISPDWRTGTKATVIQSVPLDDVQTIVLAIRGTQTIRDWTINLRTGPKSPREFLDDPSNLCHSGFLSVAKKMVRPVAARLRALLEERPGRASYSLLLTGHSAGGAVASLLYCHMLSERDEAASELTHLRAFFKRIHCITFGAPPISIKPLQKPARTQYRKFVFFSFINEGDPVPRAEKTYVRSLLDLYLSPLPAPASQQQRPGKDKHKTKMIWPIPLPTLSPAGRLVLLRAREMERTAGLGIRGALSTHARQSIESAVNREEDVEAYGVTNGQLQDAVFGDPLMHVMDLYARRIEILAVAAVTVRV